MKRLLLVDISNSFTKAAVATGKKIGRVHRIPTRSLDSKALRAVAGSKPPDGVVLASVVPSKNRTVLGVFPQAIVVGPLCDLGIGIDYPNPAAIGADRLANAAGCVRFHGAPAIVVDFGTAVTFDVVSAQGNYIGGVIAPGLGAMTTYLHKHTALLPHIRLREPKSAVGRSTREAMLSGAVHGYRGLVKEIAARVSAEAFPRKKPLLVATGGDAELIAGSVKIFDAVDPLLTLRGLLTIAERNL
ncbi:MAG: type III pantothenate kinase [Terrimicrobiaceae bacterium]|jgi:type III pantothenate kinase